MRALTSPLQLADGRFAEVRYFLEGAAHGQVFTLAMISLFSPPDADLLRETFGVLCVCKYLGDASRTVIDAKQIVSVVAMVPLPPTEAKLAQAHPDTLALRFFLIEKPGLEIAFLGGIVEDDADVDA